MSSKSELKKCKYCGKEFISRYKHKFCSSECCYKNSLEMQKKMAAKFKELRVKFPIMKKCKGCGKEFADVSDKSMYCSLKCRQAYYYRKYRKKKSKRKSHIYICKNCGKEFECNREKKTCSDKCKTELIKYIALTRKISKNKTIDRALANSAIEHLAKCPLYLKNQKYCLQCESGNVYFTNIYKQYVFLKNNCCSYNYELCHKYEER